VEGEDLGAEELQRPGDQKKNPPGRYPGGKGEDLERR